MYQENIELVWFLIGVFTYRTITALLAYGHMANFVHDVYEQSLKFIAVIAEDVAFIKGIKYKHMVDAGFTEEQLSEIEKIDDRAFSVWKNVCISHMIVNCPKYFKGYIKFQDWNSAMQQLNKIHEKEKRKHAKKKK